MITQLDIKLREMDDEIGNGERNNERSRKTMSHRNKSVSHTQTGSIQSRNDKNLQNQMGSEEMSIQNSERRDE